MIMTSKTNFITILHAATLTDRGLVFTKNLETVNRERVRERPVGTSSKLRNRGFNMSSANVIYNPKSEIFSYLVKCNNCTYQIDVKT